MDIFNKKALKAAQKQNELLQAQLLRAYQELARLRNRTKAEVDAEKSARQWGWK